MCIRDSNKTYYMGNRPMSYHESVKRRYLRALENAQLDFLEAERRSDSLNTKNNLASFVVAANDEPLDWKARLEAYLDIKQDVYFWAKELLQYEMHYV
eukprot:TRINITY_DN8864_c0_g1_i1.p1 TRINITY_DN8864_c0_g1~~TRINITY_DN8864_c0_g1_i1.p1  ORF type:complete len:113 (-),score=18.74 TRINITY_DN8864_c0_g1_i1:259-552(-)